ncbi:GntR family transcriptional regulator [Dictyobacter arantiisoli]|uniref:GntR family transcriptional regulator n=1 Tax=Dictyobacter arantiisoli TaxID=2014874 RepID=A0A5A5TDP4_9CHLR|nr:GntR family transcriptional regulator [Dictyobacter arantiisoli]
MAEKIVAFITSTNMKPGDRLPTEQRLGEQFGVSRSIVREAIKYLTATGLVAARKGVGIYVAQGTQLVARPAFKFSMVVDPEHIQALFEFRCMQEMITARLATEQITLVELRELEQIVQANRAQAEAAQQERFMESDDRFHLAIAHATHNPFLVETVASILHLQRWAVKVMTGGSPGSSLASVEHHEAIFEAIKGGNPDTAAQAAQHHVETVLGWYRQEVRRRLLGNSDGTTLLP